MAARGGGNVMSHPLLFFLTLEGVRFHVPRSLKPPKPKPDALNQPLETPAPGGYRPVRPSAESRSRAASRMAGEVRGVWTSRSYSVLASPVRPSPS